MARLDLEASATTRLPEQPRASVDLWPLLLVERPRLMRLARARGASQHDAEDCVQEALARVANKVDVEVRTLPQLLTRVVCNLVIDKHRERARDQALALRDHRCLVPPADEIVCDWAEGRWFAAQLPHLRDRERAVLVHRAAGQSVNDTATALGMTYKAVEGAYTRGRKHMIQLWQATLGLVFVAVARVFRRTTTAGATTATLTAAVLTVAVLFLPGAPPVTSLEGAVELLPRAVQAVGDGQVVPQAAASDSSITDDTVDPFERSASPSTGDRRRVSPSGVTPIVPPTGLPGIVHFGGVGIEDEATDESLQETLERCVAVGLEVTLTSLHCKGR